MKSYYDILGVSPTATREQIVTAYRLRSKILHPDRLNPQKQRAEWELANEMLKELNHAYATLRDPAMRAAYDRSTNIPGASARTDGTAARRAEPPPPPPPPQRSSILPDLAAGHMIFKDLPATLQQRLIERRLGKIRQQFTARVGRVGFFSYLLAAGCCFFFWNLVSNSATQRWDSETHTNSLTIAVIGAAILPLTIFRIIRFYRSPLKRSIFVTPLYFIETRHDELWYWPIWDVRRIGGTHRYVNSIYYGTDVVIAFPNEERSYRIRPQTVYQNLVEAFRIFSQKIAQADAQSDRQYFHDEDDFLGVREKRFIPRGAGTPRFAIAAALVAFLSAVGATLVALNINENAPKPPPVRLGTSGAIPLPAVSPTAPVVAPLATGRDILNSIDSEAYDRSKDPPNGYVYKNYLRQGYGTLRIQNGTVHHAVVKLVDTAIQHSVFTVFVGAEEEFTIRNISDGTYRLAFASGRRWNWTVDGFDEPKGSSVFHDSVIFNTTLQQEAGRNVTYYHRFEVTLQPVVNGNARTEIVSPGVFEQY